MNPHGDRRGVAIGTRKTQPIRSPTRGDRVLDHLRERLTYANVMSTVAVFVALGGSSYAALHIGSGDIADNSIRGNDVRNHSLSERELKRNTLGSRSIRESRLSRVPRARNADRLAGLTATDLKMKCPSGTFPTADVCVETMPRAAASYGTAVVECATTGLPAGPGRRLPTHGELRAALAAVQLAPGGELTSEVYPSSTSPGELDVLFVTDRVGSAAVTPNTGAGGKAFRCVADPLN
jgi:hypothetical protein